MFSAANSTWISVSDSRCYYKAAFIVLSRRLSEAGETDGTMPGMQWIFAARSRVFGYSGTDQVHRVRVDAF